MPNRQGPRRTAIGPDLTNYFNYLAHPGGNFFTNLYRMWLCGDPACMGTTPEGMSLTRRINNDVNQINSNTRRADSSAAAMMVFLGMPRPNLPDEYQVFNPADKGITIGEIDTVWRGALTELKSARWAPDPQAWVSKVVGQLNRYVEARQYIPGWEDSPIGLRFTEPGVNPALRSAVQSAVGEFAQNEEVDVLLTFAEDE